MTPTSAIATILKCVIAFALLGGAIGLGLGAIVPGYYRTVIANGRDPNFDPLMIGFGLGLGQGAFAGGVALVMVFAWRETRLRATPAARHSGRRFLAYAIALAAMFCIYLAIAYAAGHFNGEHFRARQQFHTEQGYLEKMIEGEPAFSRIVLILGSDGRAYLEGEVPTVGDLERLRVGVIRTFGEPRSKDLLFGVDV